MKYDDLIIKSQLQVKLSDVPNFLKQTISKKEEDYDHVLRWKSEDLV